MWRDSVAYWLCRSSFSGSVSTNSTRTMMPTSAESLPSTPTGGNGLGHAAHQPTQPRDHPDRNRAPQDTNVRLCPLALVCCSNSSDKPLPALRCQKTTARLRAQSWTTTTQCRRRCRFLALIGLRVSLPQASYSAAITSVSGTSQIWRDVPLKSAMRITDTRAIRFMSTGPTSHTAYRPDGFVSIVISPGLMIVSYKAKTGVKHN